MKRRSPATIVASARPEADRGYRSVTPPIFVSDTYRWDDIEEKPDFDYSRTVNPNRALLVDALSELEGAAGGVVTGSGQSAALLALLRLPLGARVLAPHDCYGGTFRLLQGLSDQGKIRADFVDMQSSTALDAALIEPFQLLWIETPSNPLLRISDIARLSAIAREKRALSIADNTLPTPCRQRPLDLGCDLVLHSTTKALNGHGDLFGGALLASDEALVEELEWWSNAAGLNGSAQDCAQILRGLRTLPLRVDKQESSARRLAQFLVSHPAVEKVHYPGLDDHPGHQLASRQQTGPGFLLSFQLRGGLDDARKFVGGLRVITLASSLGGFATLICAPATMTHRGMPAEAQAEAGIDPGLLRISVGLEDADDLLSDLERGFAAVG